jgi:hypothetical protein
VTTIDHVSPRAIINAITCDLEGIASIGCLDHNINVIGESCLKVVVATVVKVVRAGLLTPLLVDYAHFLAHVLHIIEQLLKVGVVVHGGAHLHRFRILPVLLGGGPGLHGRKHFLNTGIVRRLNQDALVVLIDASMADVLDVGVRPSGLFQAISHIKGLLARINCGSSGSITLYVRHIQYATIW